MIIGVGSHRRVHRVQSIYKPVVQTCAPIGLLIPPLTTFPATYPATSHTDCPFMIEIIISRHGSERKPDVKAHAQASCCCDLPKTKRKRVALRANRKSL